MVAVPLYVLRGAHHLSSSMLGQQARADIGRHVQREQEGDIMELTNEQLVEMYRRMVRIRRFEENVVDMVASGEIPGAAHTSIGQEGEIVGACMALRPDDYMVGNHRSHGHPIGKGANLKGLMAELLGKRTGVNRGKSGSLHLA